MLKVVLRCVFDKVGSCLFPFFFYLVIPSGARTGDGSEATCRRKRKDFESWRHVNSTTGVYKKQTKSTKGVMVVVVMQPNDGDKPV